MATDMPNRGCRTVAHVPESTGCTQPKTGCQRESLISVTDST